MSHIRSRFTRSSIKLAASALCAALASSSLLLNSVEATAAPQAAPSSEQDVKAQFLAMVGKLDKMVKTAKKQVFLSESEVGKLKKRVEAAGWRVTAARERFDKTQSELSTTNEPSKLTKLKQQLATDRRLLQTDAKKLGELLTKSQQLQAKSTEMAEQLRPLKDDVSIEADRFDPSEAGQKRAVKLVAEADWALERLEALNAEFQSEFDTPANETIERTHVD